MKKFALIFVAICAMVGHRVSGQPCPPFSVVYSYDPTYYVGDTIKINFSVNTGSTGPYKFYGVGMPPGATLDSLTGQHRYRPTTQQAYNFSVIVKDVLGCTQTVSVPTLNVVCRPGPTYYYSSFPPGAVWGIYYERAVPISPILYPPYTQFVGSGLPQGLAVTPDGKIAGTPTQAGVYFNVLVTVTGLGGCMATTNITMVVDPGTSIQSPWVSPLCAQSTSERNWVLHNPNAFNMNIEWQTIYFNIVSGSFVAAPGDNFFSTPNAAWPNSIRVTWYDDFGDPRQIVQGSNDDLCTPPSCVQVDGITFYNQGLQRNFSPVATASSNPNAVKGSPDALDQANTDSKSFSLGFYGFITVKLTADLYDQPGPDLKVWENSLNNPTYGQYPERAEVFVSTDNSNWISLGLTNPTSDCRAKLDWSFDLSGKAAWCRYIKVVDKTGINEWMQKRDPITCASLNMPAFDGTADGFDLDAITCVYSAPPNNPPPVTRMASDENELPPVNDKADGMSSVLSPNPATSSISFDFTQEPGFVSPASGQIEINIIDMAGRTMSGQMVILDNGMATHSIDQLSPGFFVAKVRTTGFARYYKFIKN